MPSARTSARPATPIDSVTLSGSPVSIGNLERLDALADLLGEADGAVELRLGQHDEELLAAEAADEVGLPKLRPELRGDALEHQVAGQMAVAVVDPLEAIEVGEGDRERPVVADGAAPLAVEDLQHRLPAVESGEPLEGRGFEQAGVLEDGRRLAGEELQQFDLLGDEALAALLRAQQQQAHQPAVREHRYGELGAGAAQARGERAAGALELRGRHRPRPAGEGAQSRVVRREQHGLVGVLEGDPGSREAHELTHRRGRNPDASPSCRPKVRQSSSQRYSPMRGSLPRAGSSATSPRTRWRNAALSGKRRRSMSRCSRLRSGLKIRPRPRVAAETTQTDSRPPSRERAKSAPPAPSAA